MTALLPTACVTDPVTGRSQFSLVQWSIEDEMRTGREYAPNVESQFDAVSTDADATRVLGDLVREMVTHSVRRDAFQFRFKILNSSVPNALALPGGYVYITRGLVALLESEGQFISVMGHELGHVEHQHSMHNQSSGQITGVLTAPLRGAAALTRGLPGERVVGLAAGIATMPFALWGLRFSRAQETEADERGVYFAARMGYDPREGIKTFQMFERLEREAGSSSVIGELGWLRSHPLNRDRIANIQNIVARNYPELLERSKERFRPTSGAFQSTLERFRKQADAYKLHDQAMQVVADPAVTPAVLEKAASALEQAASLIPEEPLFLVARGEVAVVGRDRTAARAHFSEALALYERLTPGDSHWKAHLYLGVLDLEEKQSVAAVGHLLAAKSRFPLQPIIHFLLGEAHELNGDPDLAKAAFREAMDLSPSDSGLYREARNRWRRL